MKLFVSYAHNDEEKRDELIKHLAVLEREEGLEIWTDRLLVAGDKINEKIENALEKADVFLFLLSSDFLSSFYCVQVELETALKRAAHSHVKIVGVVLRPCEWKRTQLGEYLALPKDGKSVSEWNNPDLAYLNVVQEIRRLRQKMKTIDSERDRGTRRIPLTEQWQEFLDSTEIAFSHPRKSELTLKDVFVSPHLKILSEQSSETSYSSIEKIISNVSNDSYHLILGGSQSGKTTLIKQGFESAYDQGFYPVVLDSKNISSTAIKKACSGPIKAQYAVDDFERFVDERKPNLIFLIDNFEEIRLNRRHQEQLLENLKASGCGLIVTGGRNLEYVEPEYLSEAAGFKSYRIRDFGHVKRSDLIRQWVQLGRQETIDEAEEVRELNKFERHVNGVLRKNIVPPKPLYVLSILQSLDAFTVNDYKLTSYGHCYNFLIQQALQNGRIKVDELDAFINLLTHLAYFIFDHNKYAMTREDWEIFSDKYSGQFLMPEGALDALIDTRILRERDNGVEFAHKYIYFYYAGKYLAEELERGRGLGQVEALCLDMHLEQNANILIFITHHTKSSGVIEQIALYADESFSGRSPSTLDVESTKFLAERRNNIPDLVVEARSFEEERRRRAERKDHLEDSFEGQEEDSESGFENDEVFKDINRSAKTVEIVGQIIRNRYGSLTLQEIHDLLESALWAGLRFMDFFVELMCDAEDDLIEMIAGAVSASDEPLSEAQQKKLAKSIYTRFCYGGILSILLKISGAIGHKKILDMVRSVEADNPDFVSIRLVSIALELEFSRNFPKKRVESVSKSLSGNVVADRVFKEIIVNHLYLNFVERQDKQWIATELGIPLADQNRIEGARGSKRFPKQ